MRQPRALSCLILVSLLALTALAGENHWTLQGPFGGTIYTLEFDPADPSIVYAGTQNGLFRSLDGGQSWVAATGVPIFVVYDIDVAKGDPTKVFAATLTGIYRSDDRGVTWRRMESTGPTSQIAVSHDGKTFYSFWESTLTRFSNGRETFTTWDIGLPLYGYIDTLTVDPQDPLTLYASLISEGVYKSVDGGARWTAKNKGLAAPLYRTVVVDPSNRNTLYVATGTGIYKSTDRADTWSALSIGPPTTCWWIAVSDSAPSTLVAATDRGVLRSTNGGTTWTAPRLSDAKVVAVDPRNPAKVLAAAGAHLFRSTDDGVNYTPAEAGMTSQPATVIAVDPRNRSTVYAAGPGGLFQSTDRGLTWSVRGPISPAPSSISALAVDALDPLVLYSISRGVLSRSVNGGESWQLFATGWADAVAADPRASGTLYAILGGTLYRKSADSAWTARRTGIPTDFGPSFVVVDPQDSATLYLGSTEGLFKSTNAGESWTALEYPRYYNTGLAIDPFDPQHLFLSASPRVRESRDGGMTWSDLTPLPRESTIVFDPSIPGRIYARSGSRVSASVLSQSNDGGRTWTTFPNPDGTVDATLLAIAPDGSTLYAGGPRAGVWTYHFPVVPVGRRRAARH